MGKWLSGLLNKWPDAWSWSFGPPHISTGFLRLFAFLINFTFLPLKKKFNFTFLELLAEYSTYFLVSVYSASVPVISVHHTFIFIWTNVFPESCIWHRSEYLLIVHDKGDQSSSRAYCLSRI